MSRGSINAQLSGYNRCMDDLRVRLDALEGHRGFADDAASDRPLSIVVYDTLALQVSRFHVLAAGERAVHSCCRWHGR